MDQFMTKNRPLTPEDIKNMSDDELANALSALYPPAPVTESAIPAPQAAAEVPSASSNKRFQYISEQSPLPSTPMTDSNSRSKLYQYLQDRMTKDYVPGLREANEVQKGMASNAAGLGIIEAGATIGKALAGGGPQEAATTQAQAANRQGLEDYLKQKQLERSAQYDQLSAAKEISDIEQAKERARLDAERARNEDAWKRKMYNLEVSKLNEPSKTRVRVDANTGRRYKEDAEGNFVGWVEMPNETGEGSYYKSLFPKDKSIYDAIEKEVAADKVVQGSAESLSTINQIQPKLEAARKGDTGQLNPAIRNAARAIGGEKGVMTDADVIGNSGLPVDWVGKTVDQVFTQVNALDKTQQIQTLEKMVMAAKMTYNKNLDNINAQARAKAKKKGLNVPDTENFLPPSASALQVNQPAPQQQQTAQTLKHKDGFLYEKTDKGWKKTTQKWK